MPHLHQQRQHIQVQWPLWRRCAVEHDGMTERRRGACCFFKAQLDAASQHFAECKAALRRSLFPFSVAVMPLVVAQ